MSRKFLTALDLAKNELQNAVVQNLASAPSSPVKGQLYFNSTGGDNTLYWWDGTSWVPAKSSGGAFPGYGSITAETTFGGTSADGVSTTVARSDHKHANPLHDNAAHSTIPLNALATATAGYNMGGFQISGLASPTGTSNAATKQYVDDLVQGLAWKDAARAATTANIALSGNQTIDGFATATGDRILVKNQSTAAENGLYMASAAGWTRTTDADVATELEGMAVYITDGTTQADTAWTLTTNAPITVGTTGLVYAQFSGASAATAGAGLTASGNVINVVAADTTLTVNPDSLQVNTAVIATVASLSGYAPTSRTVTAGAGLTGGGDLSANRTFDVVAADSSLVVAADSITRGALTGDVTAAQGSNVTAIAANAVINADLADMPANTIKGNNTGATADPIDLTVAQVRTMLGVIRKFTGTVNNATSTIITHALNTREVAVDVYRTASPYETVDCDVERTDANNVTVRFTTAPSLGEYQVVIVG